MANLVVDQEMADGAVSQTSFRVAKDLHVDDYILIDNSPCLIQSISRSRDNREITIRGVELFGSKRFLGMTVPKRESCEIPHVDLTEYEVYGKRQETRNLRLRTAGGEMRGIVVPADDPLQIMDKPIGYLWVTIMSAMGMEEIVSVRYS